MDLLVLRHAIAHDMETSDFNRALTKEGHQQAKTMAKFCRQIALLPDLVLCSPLVRARETAEDFVEAAKLGVNHLQKVAFLSCGMTPALACAELSAYAKLERLMIVGHEPDLSGLIGHLVGRTGYAAVKMSKATLAVVRCTRLQPGGGELIGHYPAATIRRLF
ncbi:MAG: histidine phosphatase family protein [Verrucomicrobiales bacterium]